MMHRAAVVPQHQRPGFPAHTTREYRLRDVFEQKAYQGLRFALVQTIDTDGVSLVDIERTAPGLRMPAHQWM